MIHTQTHAHTHINTPTHTRKTDTCTGGLPATLQVTDAALATDCTVLGEDMCPVCLLTKTPSTSLPALT